MYVYQTCREAGFTSTEAAQACLHVSGVFHAGRDTGDACYCRLAQEVRAASAAL